MIKLIDPFVETLLKEQEELDDCTKYALDVYTNKLVTSKYVKYQCARHLLFLYKEKTDPDFLFCFKKKPLRQLISFSKNIIIPQTNQPFVFPPFRRFMAGFVFGWRYKTDVEKLITTEIFDVEARKQWKSSFWSMLMLAVICGFTNDSFAEVYTSGPTRDTSRIPFDTARDYLFKSPRIAQYFKSFNSIRITGKKGGVIKHLPFEKNSIEGKNFSLGILTEYHLHPSDEIQESFKSGRNMSRKNQLIVYDTTKGHNIDSVCFEREKQYKKFLEDQINDPSTIEKNYDIFLWAAELDAEDYEDWKNPDLWIKANPNLNVSVSLDQLKAEFNKITSHKEEVEFKTKRLGMWVGQALAHFTLTDIMASEKETKPIVDRWLKNQNKNKYYSINVCGIDLSSIHDTTHCVLNMEIPDPNGGEPIWYFIGKGFVPGGNLYKKELVDRANYNDWSHKDFCIITPGEIINYEYLIDTIQEWKKIYKIDKVGYDPWAFNIVKQTLFNNNIFAEEDVIPIPQGIKLSPIFKEFERKLKARKICFGGNEMLMNHTLNVITKTAGGTGENLTIQKISKTQRIDGFIAMLISSQVRIEVAEKASKINAYIISPKCN